jgi:hypothetical protein
MCDVEMPENWQGLSEEALKGLTEAFGIYPICHECIVKREWHRYGQEPPVVEDVDPVGRCDSYGGGD